MFFIIRLRGSALATKKRCTLNSTGGVRLVANEVILINGKRRALIPTQKLLSRDYPDGGGEPYPKVLNCLFQLIIELARGSKTTQRLELGVRRGIQNWWGYGQLGNNLYGKKCSLHSEYS